jgi:hypothetical protein
LRSFLVENSFKSKLKNYRRNLGIALGIVGKPFDKWDFFSK